MTTGTGDSAYLVFIAFYVVCVAVTWVVYLRPGPRSAGLTRRDRHRLPLLARPRRPGGPGRRSSDGAATMAA